MRPQRSPARPVPARLRAGALLLAVAALLGSGGCVYRMAIQQGNFLELAQVDQLQQGMTRSQVSYLLGTPMVPNGFDADRWDYYYYSKERRLKAMETRRLTVWFEDDRVARIERGPGLEPKPAEPAKPADAATPAAPASADPATAATAP